MANLSRIRRKTLPSRKSEAECTKFKGFWMNYFVKHPTRFIAIQVASILSAQSRNFKGSFRVSFARKLPPTTALSLVSEVNAIFLRVSAVFSLRQTTRSACHRHYHTRRCRRRGLHVEEPIISDEENQSAFPRRRRAGG